MNKILISNKTKIEKALKIFDKLGGKCLYVIKKNKFLVGSLTDGDWRRASLKGKSKKSTVSEICNKSPIKLNKDTSLEQIKKIFKNKTILFTGGTGSLGNEFTRLMLEKCKSFKKLIIFSRDEFKQYNQRQKFKSYKQFDKLRFFLGDVRDKKSIRSAMKGVDFVFHAAALKQVPSCEFYPMEAVKTNILGTNNVVDVAVENNVEKVICLSTDKAVYPINAMGVSKAMMEKVFVAKSRTSGKTKIIGTRYGNVMASRGSVIPLFYNQLINNKPLTITNPNMTRFMMTLDNAVDLVLYAFENGKNGDIFVQKAPSSTIEQLANVMIKIYKSKSTIKNIGIRHGEKMHETLLSKEERLVSEDLGNYFRIPTDNRDLNYEKYFEKGLKSNAPEEFNSFNANRLKDDELANLLSSIGYN